jgi:Holliday junction DNA helicase RuvB
MEYLVTLCLRHHSLVHEGLLVLSVDERGGMIALDKDGNPLKKEGGPAAALRDTSNQRPLTVIERDVAKDTEKETGGDPESRDPRGSSLPSTAALSTVHSMHAIEDLPPKLSAAEWRALQGRLEWSPQRRVFVFRAEVTVFPEALFPKALLPEEPPRDPRGSFRKKGSVSQKDLEKRGQPLLRPCAFAAFVGQSRVVGNLRLAARAARHRGEPLGHVILSGPGGLGKTTLAHLIASEMEAQCHTATAPHIEQPHQLISVLARLHPGDVFFIDEIHRLTKVCEECLYSALEDGVVDVLVAHGSQMRTIRIVLECFTLVGATTQLCALSEPFRSRFKLQERLEFYSEDELAEVIQRAAPRLGTAVSPEAAGAVARRARGIPREALRLLERVRDVAQSSPGGEIDVRHVDEVGERLGIDKNGLGPDDREILQVLISQGRPMGIEAISATLRMDPNTVKLVHEPYLVERGYIVRGARGREATSKARFHYGIPRVQAS